MPRIHSVKTTKVYLPSSTSKADPPTLEVLMMAQKIARDRGQVFDIEAFMPPEMRAEWVALQKGKESPAVKAEDVDVDVKEGVEAKGDERVDTAQHADSTNSTIPRTEEAKTSVEPAVVSADHANGATVSDVSSHSTEGVDQATSITKANGTETGLGTPTVGAEDEPAPPTAKEPFKLHANHPVLLNLHWKQRQKRLAQLAARDAAIARGEVPEYFPELEALIRGEEEKENEKAREEEVGQKRKRGLTAADVEGIRASASHWNHLLIEARRARGPQWDYSTQQHLVDRSSDNYYTHMKPPRTDDIRSGRDRRQSTNAGPSQPPPQQQLTNGHAPVPAHATPSSTQSMHRPLPAHRQSSSPVKPTMPITAEPPMPPSGHPERRLSGAQSGSNHTQPGQAGPPPNFAQAYNQQHSLGMSPHTQQQQQQGMYQPIHANGHPPPPQQSSQMQIDPAQLLAFQQHQQMQRQAQAQAQAQGQGQNQANPGSNPNMMNPAALMQAQQRLQQQAQQQRANGGSGTGQGQAQGQGQGINMAALMAQAQAQQGIQGQGQGQGQNQWNPNMGLSPAMMQSMGGPMLGAGGGGAGWNGGQ